MVENLTVEPKDKPTLVINESRSKGAFFWGMIVLTHIAIGFLGYAYKGYKDQVYNAQVKLTVNQAQEKVTTDLKKLYDLAELDKKGKSEGGLITVNQSKSLIEQKKDELAAYWKDKFDRKPTEKEIVIRWLPSDTSKDLTWEQCLASNRYDTASYNVDLNKFNEFRRSAGLEPLLP